MAAILNHLTLFFFPRFAPKVLIARLGEDGVQTERSKWQCLQLIFSGQAGSGGDIYQDNVNGNVIQKWREQR
jgi:hypothetical protein